MKNLSKINQIHKYQKKDQSQFRVHFHLMNIYCSDNNYDKFLNMITQKISSYIKAQIVQIQNIVDDNHVDLSVGAQNDKQAAKFLLKKTKISLPYQNSIKQYQPRISTVFQTYIDKHKSQLTQKKYVSSSSESSEMQYQSNKEDKSDAYSEKYKNKQMKDYKRSSQTSNKIFYCLWLFGIPVEFNQRQVEYRLREYRLFFRISRWKMIEDMEFLQIQLQNPINYQAIEAIDLRVGRYPIVVIPKLRNQEYVYDQIKRFECQITSKQAIDEAFLMKTAFKFGGILSIIKDVYSPQNMYILVFNNHHKLNRFKKVVQQQIKTCTIKAPLKPIRIGRYQKYFSCEHLFAQHFGGQNISFTKY